MASSTDISVHLLEEAKEMIHDPDHLGILPCESRHGRFYKIYTMGFLSWHFSVFLIVAFDFEAIYENKLFKLKQGILGFAI